MKAFFQQHTLSIAILAIVLSLFAIFYLQYRSLRTQATTMSTYRREAMLQYLKAVTDDVRKFYSDQAERVLRVPRSAITNQPDGVIQDDANHSRSLAAVADVATHFKAQQFLGAKRFFVVVATEQQGLSGGQVFFYNPQKQAMEPDPQAPEMRAINVASAPYLIYIRGQVLVYPMSVGTERDLNHRLIVKPIVDEEQKIVAVAGLTLDQEYFKKEVVPRSIQATLPKFFPTEQQDALVTLSLADRSTDMEWLLFSTQPTEAISKEARLGFDYGFGLYNVGIRMRSQTIEEWTRRNLIINVGLWSLIALFLIAGIALALRMAARERKLSQMKTDFIANVSHELRTPLASLLVFSDLLKRGRVTEPEKVREYGQYIETVGQKLAQVINNILDFSRLEAGQKQFHFERCDVRAVVEEAVAACAGPLQQSGHPIEIIATETLPPVLIDAGAINLALTNLLDNAIKYSGAQQEISIRLGSEKDYVTIAITDRGIGIARAEQEKIFEKFYRVSTGMVHDVKGSGLGLSIVKHIVAAHHGHITITSELGKGSTFTVYLKSEP